MQGLSGKAHTLDDSVAVQDTVRHNVESLCQFLNFVFAFDLDAGSQVPAGYLLDRCPQAQDWLHEVLGIEQGCGQAEQDTDDRQNSGAAVDLSDTCIVSIERQSNVDPAPLQAAVVKGKGKVKNTLVEQRHVLDIPDRNPADGTPVTVNIGDNAPRIPLHHNRVAIVLGDDQKIDRLVARQNLHGVIDYRRVVFGDSSARDFALQRDGYAICLGLKPNLQVMLLLWDDGEDEDTQGRQRNRPGEKCGSRGDPRGFQHG